ncbi:hypothetical protein WME94_06055 [Sorangium sp. So ce429]
MGGQRKYQLHQAADFGNAPRRQRRRTVAFFGGGLVVVLAAGFVVGTFRGC